MKKLLVILFGVSAACLLSIQANAGDSNSDQQILQRVIHSPYGQTISVQTVQQRQQANQQVKVQDDQALQQWGDGQGPVQRLKQFSQQTQADMSSFK